MSYVERTLEKKTVFTGLIVNVRQDRAALHTGKEVRREVVEHPGGVVVLPLDRDGNVLCVRQFRYPFMEETLELPAGKLEPGEAPRPAALRELREETGCVPASFLSLGKIYTSPGFSSEVLHLFLATGLDEGDAAPDEDEYLSLERIPFALLKARALRGELPDAKTLSAVFLAEPHIGGINE